MKQSNFIELHCCSILRYKCWMQWIQQVDSRSMEKYHSHSILKHLLILCLGLALMFSQSNRLHIHPQHGDHLLVASAHVVNVHATTMLHDIDLADHHGGHHSVAIDINTDNVIKKTNLVNPLFLVVLFIGLFLYLPRLISLPRQRFYQTLFAPCYYFLHPPLRGPPV